MLLDIRISAAPLSSSSSPSLPRSVTALPQLSPTAACMLLLAFVGTSESPVGSLCLQRPAAADGSDGFTTFAKQLCLPVGDGRADIGRELLWHAVRHDACLRAGGALLATPSDAHEDLEELLSLGFVHVGLQEEGALQDTEEKPPEEGLRQKEPLLALVARRDPSGPPPDASHAALHVSDIERSLDFWSLLYFAPTRTFTTEGARAAWLSAAWSALSLELIEVPPLVLASSSCAAGGHERVGAAEAVPDASASGLGLVHLCVDVTPLGVGVASTLEQLQERSRARFGRDLRVLAAPHQQMMGDLVAEVASVRAPDGVVLELVYRCSRIVRPLEADWSIKS